MRCICGDSPQTVYRAKGNAGAQKKKVWLTPAPASGGLSDGLPGRSKAASLPLFQNCASPVPKVPYSGRPCRGSAAKHERFVTPGEKSKGRVAVDEDQPRPALRDRGRWRPSGRG